MLLDRFGRLLSSQQNLMRKASAGPLLRVGDALAGSSNCCCGDPDPTVCAGAAGVAGCFSDLYASYPNNPGSNTSMYSYLSGFQFDVDVLGTFSAPCDAATCNAVAAPFVVSHLGANVWTYSEDCTDGASNYGWTASFSWFCGGPLPAGTCGMDVGLTIGRQTGSPLWTRGVLFRQTWTTQKVFATLSETIPFASQAAVLGSPGCLYSASAGAAVAVH